MKRFEIKGLLSVEGPLLDPTTWKNTRTVEAFSQVTLLGARELVLDADAKPREKPQFLAARIELPEGTTEAAGSTTEHVIVNLPVSTGSKDATVTFFWANPLTPSSRGLWFFLVATNERNEGHRLRCVPNDQDNQLRGFAHYFEIKNDFGDGGFTGRLFLGDPKAPASKVLYTVAELGQSWKGPRELAVDKLDLSIKSCRLFTPEELLPDVHKPEDLDAGVLHADDPGHADKPQFTIEFGEARDHRRMVAGFTASKLEKGWAVNTRALRAERLTGLLTTPYRWVRPLDLKCARLHPKETEEQSVWLLDLPGVPIVGPVAKHRPAGEHLSLRAIWRALVHRYSLGLRDISVRNALSFMPTDVGNAKAGAADCTLRFTVDRTEKSWQTRLGAIAPDRSRPFALTFALVPTITGAAPIVEVTAAAESFPLLPGGETRPESVLDVTFTTASTRFGRILVGGLLLDVGARADHRPGKRAAGLRLALLDDIRRVELSQDALAVRLALWFECGRPRAASDDPERGFEVDAPWLQRERPIVIDLEPEAAKDDVVLEVRERASQQQSRVLELVLWGKEGLQFDYDVVVLDPSPFLAARVHTTNDMTTDPEGIVGIYRHDPDNPGGWELRTIDGGVMTLVLPPQAIGEEMIKGRLKVLNDNGTAADVPLAGLPFDIRLGAPAALTLDRTDIDTARAPAPWTLRRLLDRREAVVGLRLRHAVFELFYGMQTTIDAADDRKLRLRLAEQQAFLGHIPFPEDLLSALLDPDAVVVSDLQPKYASDVARWIRGLLHRPAHLPAFVDAFSRERLALHENVRFSLRKQRQTANPFALESFHDSADVVPEDKNRRPLRGGFDYGFESKNVYAAVLDEERIPPGDQGHVTGLAFGALGGNGSQEAMFDEGRTLVITTTTTGRLDALTIVRIGRIAVLGHHARHVIVYERTTRTAPRYQRRQDKPADQPFEFEGMAALRKVREFIEITQQRRGYPDFSGTPAAAGPLMGVFFETVVIPVKSSWGHDVPDGWVIALRGPLFDSEKPFYPFPWIFVEGARAPGKGAGHVSQAVKNPENLYFFTSTRPGDGGDPDRWPSFPDIDFPLTQRARPPALPPLPSFTGATRQPNAQVHDFGQRRFTIQVDGAEEAIDLMHGREAAGLEARLTNVSLARGRPPFSAPAGSLDAEVGGLIAHAEARIGDGLRELAQHVDRIAKSVLSGRIADVEGLQREALALIAALKKDAAELEAKVQREAARIETLRGDWTKWQADWTATARAEGAKAVQGWTSRLEGALTAAVDRLRKADANAALVRDEIKNRVRDAMVAFCGEASDRLRNFAFLPERAFERLEVTAARVRSDALRTVIGSRLEFHRAIDEMRSRFGAEQPGRLDLELIALVDATYAQASALQANAGRDIKDALGSWFGDLPGEDATVDKLLAPLAEIVAPFVAWLDEVRDEIPPIEIGEPDWEELKVLLSGPFEDVEAAVKAAFEAVDKRIEELRTALGLVKPGDPEPTKGWAGLRQAAVKGLSDECDKHVQLLLAAVTRPEDLEKAAGEAIAAAAKAWTKSSDDLTQAAETQIKDLTDGVFKEVAAVTKAATAVKNRVLTEIQALETILLDAGKDLATLAEAAAKAAQAATAALRAVGEQIEEAVGNELRKQIAGVQGGVLELTRALAEGPVTDTLRCTRDLVGYYYDAGKQILDVTRSGAIFNDLGGAVLNGLGATVPFDRIRDRILPKIPKFDFNRIFQDFAGLKLRHLLAGLIIPEDPLGEYDWLKVTHGFDKDRLTAWSDVQIDKEFDGDPELLTLPPISVAVARPRFRASSRIEAARDTGVSVQRTSGEIAADWTVRLSGDPILTIERGRLHFDSTGAFGFDFSAQDLALAPALQFVTDLLSALVPSEGGLTVAPIAPGGVSVQLDLPLPDIGTGAFTLTGVFLHTHFDILAVGGFEIRTGLWLSRPDRPFGLAVLFLGGGGWFGVDVRYRPPDEFETHVSIGLAAGAFISLNFGVARGSAGLMLAVGLDFRRNWLTGGSGQVAVSLSLLVWGEFSVLGIVSVFIRVVLRIEYRNGAMTGYGSVRVSVKICWCFTLSATVNMRVPLGSGGGSRAQALRAAGARHKDLGIAIPDAVIAHFDNIDW